MARFEWPGFDRLSDRLKAIGNPTHDRVRPLMEKWERVIWEDNRRGVMAGTDKDDRPLVPVKPRMGRYKGKFGPPLAPSGEQSRVISNLVTDYFQDGRRWVAIGTWENVVSDRGVAFLPFHFRGEGRLPVRDLAGIRRQGIVEANRALAEWVRSLLGD